MESLYRDDDPRPVRIKAGMAELQGDLTLPRGAEGVVLFAHGSGSSRHSPRNQAVACFLNDHGLGTLLMDLLTEEEDARDRFTAQYRFDIELLADRLLAATSWLTRHPETQSLRIGYFGASTGAGAALIAAGEHPKQLGAVVSRGGRPDLAGPWLPAVEVPTLLIVGGDDTPVIGMNRSAFEQLRCEKVFEIVPGATHLFEEPGTLERVAELTRDWFEHHLMGKSAARAA